MRRPSRPPRPSGARLGDVLPPSDRRGRHTRRGHRLPAPAHRRAPTAPRRPPGGGCGCSAECRTGARSRDSDSGGPSLCRWGRLPARAFSLLAVAWHSAIGAVGAGDGLARVWPCGRPGGGQWRRHAAVLSQVLSESNDPLSCFCGEAFRVPMQMRRALVSQGLDRGDGHTSTSAAARTRQVRAAVAAWADVEATSFAFATAVPATALARRAGIHPARCGQPLTPLSSLDLRRGRKLVGPHIHRRRALRWLVAAVKLRTLAE